MCLVNIHLNEFLSPRKVVRNRYCSDQVDNIVLSAHGRPIECLDAKHVHVRQDDDWDTNVVG